MYIMYVVFPSLKMMFVYKKIWTGSDLETCLCDDVTDLWFIGRRHKYQLLFRGK